MEHYSTNAKNRKLKKQIQGFLSRLGFAGGKLPGSGQLILLMSIFLFVSLFLPWLQITSATQGIETYSAFSRHMGFIGYGIVIGISIITFFLLSHTKKEHIRAYVPFRLSDTQAIIFVTSMLLVAVIQLLILLPAYQSFGGVHVQSGFLLAWSSLVMILLLGFYLSKSIKIENTESYYLHKDFDEKLWEYKNIIHPDADGEKERKKQNMSLPI